MEGVYPNLIGWVDTGEECTDMNTNAFRKNTNLRAHRYKINDCVWYKKDAVPIIVPSVFYINIRNLSTNLVHGSL